MFKRQLISLLLASALSSSLRAQAPASAHGAWYEHAVIYEIYPRSFQDTNGDGVGDLNGITQRLDYLQSLGVDAIWIAPMYPSPQVDFGYDIANYEAVDPQYGTLADMDRLIAEAKKRHIRVLLDMVLNHTSDKHPWFVESAGSKTNPRADWFIWNDGKATNDTHAPNAHQGPHGWVVPPNDWSSLFQGSAWEWVPARGQFYYHFFYKQQPDLNWRNPAVEKAMFDAMRFWLDRGVAGFRLDAVTTLFEDPELHDDGPTGKLDASGFPESNHVRTSGLPEVHDVMRRLRVMVDGYHDERVLVGEIYVPATAELLGWYGPRSAPELQLPMDTLVGFHTEAPGQETGKNVALNIAHFRKTIVEMEAALDGHQPLLVFDNHDNTRSWDRFGDGAHNPLIARLIATMLFTTRSAALLYYGQELGMATHTPTQREDVRDPIGITGWPKEKGRDGERTPMQWTSGPQAGFSSNPQTWLPVAADRSSVNVASESADASSLLNWYRTLAAIRRGNPTMRDGALVMLDATNPAVLSYARMPVSPSGHALVVSLNMTAQPQVVHLDLKAAGIGGPGVKTLLGDAAALNGVTSLATFMLPPYATLIAEVQ